jgi:hypothetical protein
MHVLKERLGLPHTDARNALFHGADIEADMALWQHATKHDKATIRHLAEQAFVEGYGIEARQFAPLQHSALPFIIDAFNTRADIMTLDIWRTEWASIQITKITPRINDQ